MSAPSLFSQKASPYFIAEVSSNHGKDLQRSLDFIDSAAEAGCDAVKFQLFKIDHLFAPEILARSEKLSARKNWELPLEFLPELASYCHKRKVDFGCTPFYLDAVDELVPYVDFFKVASYEMIWLDLVARCVKTAKPLIISAGMATMDEIIATHDHAKQLGCKDLILLHCTSAYPTPHDEANLQAIETMRQATGARLGWSDHTVDAGVMQRAIHRWGASVVEFHLDLDGNGDEYAAGHCWLPDQIALVIRDTRHAFAADGNGIKAPTPSELPDRDWRADPTDGLRPLKSIRATALL
jgi:sialic acid synthase SpsE